MSGLYLNLFEILNIYYLQHFNDYEKRGILIGGTICLVKSNN